jgi:hypothetical protein
MSILQYKNPISPIQVLNPFSVARNELFGTNFSVLGVGGFMEVYNLDDLQYTIPSGRTGTIEFSGNTIPIQFKKGSGSVFSPDVLTLNSDNISSGRRRLGMLVYVYETDKIYQFIIRNYDSLWSGATGSTGPGGQTVVVSDFGTTVKNNSVSGQNFINAWTGSTIEGVNGFTSANATWRILNFSGGSSSTADTFVTGFTLSSNTITLTQNRTDQYSAFTISLSAYTGTSTTISGDYLPLSGGTVTGNTIFNSGLTANTISATTYFNLPVTADTFVTGFTLSSNTITLTQNRTDQYSAFTISLSAYTGSSSTTSGEYLPLSGGTVTGNTIFNSGLTANTLNVTGNTILSGLSAATISATTYQNLPVTADTFVTGFTLSSNTLTISQNRLDQYSAFTISLSAYTGTSISGLYLPLSGGTVTGNTIFQSGLTANTISATTYQNLPSQSGTGISAFSYSPTTGVLTITKNDTNTLTAGTFSYVSATTLSSSNVLSVSSNGGTPTTTTINAVTGGTYSNGTITLSGTGNFASSISGFPTTFTNDYLPLSGGTVTGNTIFNSGLTATTISATTYQNLPIDPDTYVTGFTLSSNTITLTQNRTDGYSSFTISLSAYTGSSSTTGAYLPLSGGTVTGDTIFQSGLTANTLNVTGNTLLSGLTATTISATTYQNLPVSGVTGGTGISADTTNGLVTIVNTTPDQVVTISGDTGISTGGTYPNFVITNTEPDQVVTISGGTNISVNGTYPNFGINFTGSTGSGGGGQIFYLNLSQSQGSNRLLSTTGSTASEQSTGVTINNGVTSTIASFQSQPLNITLLPGGIWSFYLHSYKQNNNASFNIFVEVYKRTSGGTQTLLFTTDPAPVTTNSPNPSMQLSDGYFSGTPLSVSDSIVAVVRATNTGNQSHIITLVSEGSQHYSYAVSTIPTQQGLTCDTLSGCSIIQTIQTDVSNKLDKSGGTVNGATNFTNGLTANTISATTYFNLPVSNFTGGTVSGATSFTNGLSANTISATTYENVNAVTGGTYNGTTGVITLSGTGSVNGNQITGFSTGGGGITWNSSNTTQSMTADNGYITTAATLTTFTLPSTIAFGKTVEIAGNSSGLWQLNQNSGQQIRFGNTATTVTTGILSATSQGDCIKLICVATDTSFIVTSSIGNIFFS